MRCDSASRSNFPAFLTVQRYNRSPFHEGFWPFVTYLYVYRGLQQVFVIKEHFWFLQFKTRKISPWLFCPCRTFYFRMNLWIKFETCRIEFKLIFFLHKRSNHLTPSSKLKLRLENLTVPLPSTFPHQLCCFLWLEIVIADIKLLCERSFIKKANIAINLCVISFA